MSRYLRPDQVADLNQSLAEVGDLSRAVRETARTVLAEVDADPGQAVSMLSALLVIQYGDHPHIMASLLADALVRGAVAERAS